MNIGNKTRLRLCTVRFCVLISVAFMNSTWATDSRNTVTDALAAIFDEVHTKESAWPVHQQAINLPAQKRFRFLSAWVLPTAGPSTIRLHVDFTPTHPAGTHTEDNGGQLVSPALDLIQAAKEAERLRELHATVTAIQADSLLQRKNRLALLAMILIQQERFAEALKRIDEFLPLSTVQQPDDIQYRSSEAALYWLAREYPEIREPLVSVVRTIAERKKRVNVWPIWNRQFQSLAAEAYLRAPNLKLNSTESGQWASAGLVTAKSRGGGVPSSRWQLRRGRADNTVSHDDDLLYFQSPLRGNFQVECDVDAFSWNDSEVMVAGNWVAAVYTRLAYDVGDVRGSYKRRPLETPLPRPRGALHYRTVVRDSTATTYAMGRLLHGRPLAADHDPWVAIRNKFKQSGAAYNVRITGNPAIPDELNLSTHSQLQGWIAYNSGSVGWSNSHWRPLSSQPDDVGIEESNGRGDGIFAAKNTEIAAGCFLEEALFYHRPMLEDGAIEYEFFHREGQLAAHPAIDRMCFLIQADGVKLHWLTDGIHDRTTIAPDNATVLSSALPELKNDAWNKLRLTLTGDDVQIQVNGTVVARQRLNANNQRKFGLFHYADLSELRVRNVRWTGDWPKGLPSVSEQDLAADDGEFLDRDIDHLAKVFKHDFVQQGAVDDRIAVLRGAIGSQIKNTPQGVLALRTNEGGYQNTTIAPAIRAEGDFDIIARYEDFQYETTLKGNASIMLVAMLDNATSDEFFITRRHIHDTNAENDILQCAIVQREAEGEKRDYFVTEGMEDRSGRLRLARRGDKIYFLTSEGDSPNCRLQGTRTFSTSPIKLDGIRLVNQMHRQGKSSVLWKDIIVRAEKMGGAASGIPDRRVTKLNEERSRLPQHVVYDFTKPLIDPAAIYRWRDTRPANKDHAGLKIVAPGFDSWESSGASTLQAIEGDFDISVDFQTVSLGKPAADQQTAIYLQLDLQDEGKTQVASMLNVSESGHKAAMSQIREPKRGGGYNYRNDDSASVKDVTTLRIARRGKTFTILARAAGADQDRILSMADLSDVEVSSARIMLHTGGAGRRSEILVKRFEIHADTYQPAQSVPETPLPKRTLLDSLLDRFK